VWVGVWFSSRLYYPFGKGPGQHIIRCLKNKKCENETNDPPVVRRSFFKLKKNCASRVKIKKKIAHLANREARGSSARKQTESRRPRLLHQQASVCAASCRSRLRAGIGPFLGSRVCLQLLYYCAARRWRLSCPQLAHSLLPELLLLNAAYHVQEQRPAVCLPRQRCRRRPRRPRLRARPCTLREKSWA